MSKLKAEVKIVIKHHKTRMYHGRDFKPGTIEHTGPVKTLTLFRVSRQTMSTLDRLCWFRKDVKLSIKVNRYNVRLTGLSYHGRQCDAKFVVVLVKRFGIWRVTIKHPKYVTERIDVEAGSDTEAIRQVRVKGRKLETYKARFLRGPKVRTA